MSISEFQDRFFDELFLYEALCKAQGVEWDDIADVSRAPGFAEKLILCLDEAGAERAIVDDAAGAAQLARMVDGLVQGPGHMPLSASTMPVEKLTPFYVLSALVLDMEKRNWNLFHADMFSDTNALQTTLNVFFREV